MNHSELLKLEEAISRKASSKHISINQDRRFIDHYLPTKCELEKTLKAYYNLKGHWPLAPIIHIDYQRYHLKMRNCGLPIRLHPINTVLTAQEIIQKKDFIISDCDVFDNDLVLYELNLFYEWFLSKLLGYQTQYLYESFRTLFQNFFSHAPKVIVHRDFHSENILMTPEGRIFLVDYQDAVLGPYNYDYVSLVNDAYQDTQVVQNLSFYYFSEWAKNFSHNVEQDFVIVSLQRLMKVIGIFSRLSLRDGKVRYQQYIPRLLKLLIRFSFENKQRNFFKTCYVRYTSRM